VVGLKQVDFFPPFPNSDPLVVDLSRDSMASFSLGVPFGGGRPERLFPRTWRWIPSSRPRSVELVAFCSDREALLFFSSRSFSSLPVLGSLRGKIWSSRNTILFSPCARARHGARFADRFLSNWFSVFPSAGSLIVISRFLISFFRWWRRYSFRTLFFGQSALCPPDGCRRFFWFHHAREFLELRCVVGAISMRCCGRWPL